MELIPQEFDLARQSTDDLAAAVDDERPLAVLLPVGAVEPHGPHLSLLTDVVISRAVAIRAARLLQERGLTALIAPAVPYGVTNCAAAFTGAISVDGDALARYLRAVVDGFLSNGIDHVCVINNHLEPAHDATVRGALDGVDPANASVACPLTRRWGRTLSDEFKSGACHAGKYETSIILATAPELVDKEAMVSLPEVPVSLSEKLNEGVSDFAEMGMARAYAGAPAEATAKHGEEQLALLATMVATQILESLNGE